MSSSFSSSRLIRSLVLPLVARKHLISSPHIPLPLLQHPSVLRTAFLRRRIMGVLLKGLVGGFHHFAPQGITSASDALEAGLDVLDDFRHCGCSIWGRCGL
jgi:hypothetical protein